MACVIVEESPLARRILANALRPLGLEIREASGADEALERADGAVRLIVAAWNLPGTDGVGLARRLRERPETSAVPVLLLADRADRDDVARAAEAGVRACLVRPFAPEAVLERAMRLLGSARPRSDAAPEAPASGTRSGDAPDDAAA